MATAGRILIMPKGTWNAETTYENLDMVAHGGRAWLAKKTSVGIEPSDANAEFWHDFLGMDVFTEANPPTAAQVGAVSLYADPVLSKSTDWDNLESGTYRFSTWGGSGGVGYPPIDDVGICILFDTEVGRYMYCLGMNRIVSRYYESKTWSDWIEGYLPLTGGNLNGLLHVIGDIVVNHFTQIIGNEEISCLRAIRPDGTSRGIEVVNSGTGIEEKYAARFTTYDGTTWKTSQLFGQHNKPRGTFTGNANKTSRTINIGGVYSTATELFVSGNGYSFIITPNGAIGMHYNTRSIKILLESECKYMNGVLTIATDDAAINASGITYFYQLS